MLIISIINSKFIDIHLYKFLQLFLTINYCLISQCYLYTLFPSIKFTTYAVQKPNNLFILLFFIVIFISLFVLQFLLLFLFTQRYRYILLLDSFNWLIFFYFFYLFMI
jgi:hypothetical protein